MREKTDHGAAANRAERVNDSDHRFRAHAETALRLKECCVKILRAVRHVVKGGHEQGRVNKQTTVLSDKGTDVYSRDLFCFTIALPNRRLRNTRPNVNDEQRGQGARDEETAPTEHWKDNPVNQRREQITECVTLL